MESDSVLSGLSLAISLALLTLAVFGQSCLTAVRRERVQWLNGQGAAGSHELNLLHSAPLGPAGILSPLKLLFLASSVLSAAALAISLWSNSWLAVSLLSLSTMALVAVIHATAGSLASVHGERVSLRIAATVLRATQAINPLVALMGALRVTSNGAGSAADADSPETGMSVDGGDEPLDEREVRMIRGVVRLDKTMAREIMVPRVDVVAAELGTPLDKLVEQMVEHGHSRVPVYEDSLDQIKGIAYSRDILADLSGNHDAPASVTAAAIRPALFIPESKTLEELLAEFQESQVHMAIVVDEYGGVSGLVTIEDLLEEIVGEIKDEFDVEEPEVVSVGKDEYLMDAGVSIDQLYELLSVTVEGDGFDTVGGFVYQRLGKIPSAGDAVEYDGLRIEVVSTAGRRLKRLRVTRFSPG